MQYQLVPAVYFQHKRRVGWSQGLGEVLRGSTALPRNVLNTSSNISIHYAAAVISVSLVLLRHALKFLHVIRSAPNRTIALMRNSPLFSTPGRIFFTFRHSYHSLLLSRSSYTYWTSLIPFPHCAESKLLYLIELLYLGEPPWP